MAVLTVTQIVQQGVAFPSLASPGSGSTDSFPNDGRTFLEVRTAGTASTVTIVTPYTANSLGLADQTLVMGATATSLIGPFPPNLFNGTDNNATITYNGTAGVSIGAFRLG